MTDLPKIPKFPHATCEQMPDTMWAVWPNDGSDIHGCIGVGNSPEEAYKNALWHAEQPISERLKGGSVSEKKYVEPEGMLKAAIAKHDEMFPSFVRNPREIEGIAEIVRAVLRYQAENPIVPTPEQMEALIKAAQIKAAHDCHGGAKISIEAVVLEWQRIVFLAPEPEVPEAIKDLMKDIDQPLVSEGTQQRNLAVIEAYRRGKEGR